ncbi:hypothetical protein DPMN_034494 [Dreissena polymorpha]|uniref:Uncharacterized protein n=1 Tax=Dreissena polymorpha TaxID=45954 RepID=A0A9D4M5L5_DREPO|nr:hypothetical protein DPMN_034494 [Dreissena polymorpha]
MPGSLSAAKFAQDGELFARMKLEDDLSVDSVAGRLILKSTNLVWLAPHKPAPKNNTLPKKATIVIASSSSAAMIEDRELTCDQEFSVETLAAYYVEMSMCVLLVPLFEPSSPLNRLHLCEMSMCVLLVPLFEPSSPLNPLHLCEMSMCVSLVPLFEPSPPLNRLHLCEMPMCVLLVSLFEPSPPLNHLHLCEMPMCLNRLHLYALSILDIVFPNQDLLNKLPSLSDWYNVIVIDELCSVKSGHN